MVEENKTSGNTNSIIVDGLTKTYRDFTALDQISFRVSPGEIVGFLGPNGAGKTTTMKILTCFMAATHGRASVAGFDVHTQSQQVRQRVGYLPENVPLYDDMLVWDYLKFIAEVRKVARAERKKAIEEALNLTGLSAMAHRAIRELSKGYRQRVGLAQAIIHRPDVLILDEPTTGLDPNQIVEIRDVIKEIGEQKTIIFSTHILQEVAAVSDRIIIIDKGKLVADGALGELEAKVAQRSPEILVEYAPKPKLSPDALLNSLKILPGVQAVSKTSDRPNLLAFRVESEDQQLTRAALLKAEVENPQGLCSLKRAEPTLEDIFRAYTSDQLATTPDADTAQT